MYGQMQYNAIQNQFLPRQEVVKVTGRQGAMAYQIGANSSALLLDNDPNKSIIWLVTTDGSGFKTCVPFKYEPYEEVSTDSIIRGLEAKIERLERILNESHSEHDESRKQYNESDKSDYEYAERTQSGRSRTTDSETAWNDRRPVEQSCPTGKTEYRHSEYDENIR